MKKLCISMYVYVYIYIYMPRSPHMILGNCRSPGKPFGQHIEWHALVGWMGWRWLVFRVLKSRRIWGTSVV